MEDSIYLNYWQNGEAMAIVFKVLCDFEVKHLTRNSNKQLVGNKDEGLQLDKKLRTFHV